MRFTLPDPVTLMASETGSQRGVVGAALGRTLLGRPRALDVIAAPGARPTVLTHLTFHRLFLTVDSDDATLIRHFLAACTRFPARQPS